MTYEEFTAEIKHLEERKAAKLAMIEQLQREAQEIENEIESMLNP